MGLTRITDIFNSSDFTATIENFETPTDTADGKGLVAPGATRSMGALGMWVPWCSDGVDFARRHIDVTLQLPGRTRRFTMWQSNVDGLDRVRSSTDGAWHRPGDSVGAFAEAGIIAESRVLFINNENLWLVPVPFVALGLQLAADAKKQGVICADENPRAFAVPSVPKRTAVAFSMAGIPSDALDQLRPDARFMYRDSGKRYEFTILDGNAVVRPAPAVPVLRAARSFNRKRLGEAIPLPRFDLIAANGGRVFAKEQNTDRLFFAIVDEMFVHAGPEGRELAVPSTYFKLDPEFNRPDANPRDLIAAMTGEFGGHPAAARFTAYRLISSLGATPNLVVRVRRGEWNLIDARPPSSAGASATASALADGLQAIQDFATPYAPFINSTRLFAQAMGAPAPPDGTPTYPHVTYCPPAPATPRAEPSIDFRRVLDIGVGHVHYHQQYERVTGGELQYLSALRSTDFFRDHRSIYQFFNGPVADADGYNDGTCNYYLLVELSDRRLALMFIDEQTAFSPRWRLCDPADTRGTFFPLVADLALNPSLYGWSRDQFWSPFEQALVGPRSRLAVSAQVILISGDAEPDAIYSINFSWGTMDRSWRWRKGPAADPRFFDAASVANGDEPIASGAGNTNTYFPQTIRLRDDMTIHVKGTRGGVVGRWWQRYLPASNQLVPPAQTLGGRRRPSLGYSHPWKFLSEELFQLADQFSHFGVYDQVDSRTQYYPVAPVTDGDRQSLEAIAANPADWWVDEGGQLVLNAYTFRADTCTLPSPWWPPYPRGPMRPASLFNPATFLRIVKRGDRWLAFWRDKRDDDVELLDVSPGSQVTLISRSRLRSVVVTINPGVRVDGPPAVQRAFFWVVGSQAGLAFTRPQSTAVFDNVYRVRAAALGTRPGELRPLLDVLAQQFKWIDGYYQYQWTPSSTELEVLKQLATASGAAAAATTVWFEGIAGHVAPPEQMMWAPPPVVRVTVTPSEIATGIPVTFTVHAVDAFTSQVLRGDVVIDDEVRGTTDIPITYTFQAPTRPVIGPITDGPDPVDVTGSSPPSVVVPGYPETRLPITLVPPVRPRVSVMPTSIAIGISTQVIVHAEHPTRHVAVAGRVVIDGVDTAATDAPFAYTFGAAPPSASVIATGYLNAAVVWPPLHPPRLTGSIQPYPVPLGTQTAFTVRAWDADSGTVIKATVKVNGIVVGQSDAPFSYKFVMTRSRQWDPELQAFVFTLVPPVAILSATGYPDVGLDLGLSDA